MNGGGGSPGNGESTSCWSDIIDHDNKRRVFHRQLAESWRNCTDSLARRNAAEQARLVYGLSQTMSDDDVFEAVVFRTFA
jgi:hypothetical protein